MKRFLGVSLDGYPFAAVFLTVAVVSFWLQWLWLAIPFLILTIWCLWFFRDPERTFEGKEHEVVSPADGKVIECRVVDYPYLLEGRAQKISIYMNIFNVHINRAPLTGEVLETRYLKGSFKGAFEEKASLENEQMGILLNHRGKHVLFVQIAGMIARRIVCRTQKGGVLERGQRYGLIRFGSRMDVYLPLNATLHVKEGEKVYSGKTKLGEMNHA